MTRRSRIPASDDDEEEPVAVKATPRSNDGGDRRSRRNQPRQKRRKIQLEEEEEEEEEEESRSDEEEEEEEEEEEKVQEDAKPIGDAVRVSGKGRWKINHYEAFEFDGIRFQLEDPVLLTPEDVKQKPYVAIIKDITQNIKDGSMKVNGQWFYRPEEAEKKGGSNWQPRDTRELFYSFHRDEVPAESVMHKCVVHFVPLHKQLPKRKQFPGFIVQKVYDTEQKKLFKLTDKDYEDNKQHEIDLLVNKTMARLGDLPDLNAEDTPPLDQEEQGKSKKYLRKRNLSPTENSNEDEADKNQKLVTPVNVSIHYTILDEFDALTKETHRDKWLEKLLQSVENICSPSESTQDKKGVKVDNQFKWPNAAVSAVSALERAAHEALNTDYSKYNQKLRQLVFNLKNNEHLSQRLLKGELEPSAILNMSPNQLKVGLTAEEIAKNQPEETTPVQMTDARCKRCSEKKVALVDIIQAGHGDRYQLECHACGNTWYTSCDEAAILTIDRPNTVNNVGTAPWATGKFERVEKKKANGTDKADTSKKSTDALQWRKSFNKSLNPE